MGFSLDAALVLIKGLDLFGQHPFLVLVNPVNSIQQLRNIAVIRSRMDQRINILGKARPAVAHAGIKKIFVASMQFAAYLVSSALRMLMRRSFSRLLAKGAYRLSISSATSGLSVPMMMRSGFIKSLTASPSFKNSGFETTSNGISSPRFSSSPEMMA